MPKEIVYMGDTEKRLKSFPKKTLIRFLQDLAFIMEGSDPLLPVDSIKGLGKGVKGVLELRKNGKPAYRLVYTTKDDVLYVIAVFTKTSNKTDSKHIATVKSRCAEIF